MDVIKSTAHLIMEFSQQGCFDNVLNFKIVKSRSEEIIEKFDFSFFANS